jgi:shikimate dehydrogenase
MNWNAENVRSGKAEKVWRFGLTGWPLGHSLSPTLHQTALQTLALKGDYQLFPIPPEKVEQELSTLADRLRDGGLDGLNVTVPYKQAIIPYLDGLTEAARAVGAVNTIYQEDGRLLGDNTDIGGFSGELAKMDAFFSEKAARKALVLGAGGAARAVVYVLLMAGWDVTVAARRWDQAAGLVDILPIHCKGSFSAALLDESIAEISPDLIINATPAGMWPQADDTPWPAGLILPRDAVVYDLIYNPPETCLMRASARARGGLGMLVEQAALSFEIWTGQEAPRSKMHLAAEQKLAGDI